ncbi:MAG: acyl dehydratase [Betaproteobacteria bacterium]|nr:acyl dehydratase [Betaproteobacteria bacterium]
MQGPIYLEYRSAPCAVAFMSRAIVTAARSGFRDRQLPLAATWRGHRVAGKALDCFLALTGLADDNPYWALLYPHVAGFRLQMALLTHPAFPFPIWGALQIRNHLVLHRSFARGEVLEMHTCVDAQRALEKGTEVDLRSTARAGGELAWEGLNTFYYRGRQGGRDAQSPLATAPRLEGSIATRWVAPVAARWRFGKLTGDYNGIHLSRWYARRFGFQGAFLHPQRVLGQCLARLPRPDRATPLRLDAWLKGPAYYGSDLALRVAETRDAVAFALHVDGDERPAIIGRYTRLAEYSSAILSSKNAVGLGAFMKRR